MRTHAAPLSRWLQTAETLLNRLSWMPCRRGRRHAGSCFGCERETCAQPRPSDATARFMTRSACENGWKRNPPTSRFVNDRWRLHAEKVDTLYDRWHSDVLTLGLIEARDGTTRWARRSWTDGVASAAQIAKREAPVAVSARLINSISVDVEELHLNSLDAGRPGRTTLQVPNTASDGAADHRVTASGRQIRHALRDARWCLGRLLRRKYP